MAPEPQTAEVTAPAAVESTGFESTGFERPTRSRVGRRGEAAAAEGAPELVGELVRLLAQRIALVTSVAVRTSWPSIGRGHRSAAIRARGPSRLSGSSRPSLILALRMRGRRRW